MFLISGIFYNECSALQCEEWQGFGDHFWLAEKLQTKSTDLWEQMETAGQPWSLENKKRQKLSEGLMNIFSSRFDLDFPVHAVLVGHASGSRFLSQGELCRPAPLCGFSCTSGSTLWNCKFHAWNLPDSGHCNTFYDWFCHGPVPVMHSKCVINIFSDCLSISSESSIVYGLEGFFRFSVGVKNKAGLGECAFGCGVSVNSEEQDVKSKFSEAKHNRKFSWLPTNTFPIWGVFTL